MGEGVGFAVEEEVEDAVVVFEDDFLFFFFGGECEDFLYFCEHDVT